MSEKALLVVVVVVVCTMSLAVIAQSIAVFYANRSRDRLFAQLTDLAHKLCKESMNRVLAATDLAAYYKVCDAENPRESKKSAPQLWREI